MICTPDGRNTEPVAVRPSRDYISDPMQHATTSRTKAFHHWERQNRDLEAISGPIEFRLFMAIAEYPAMQSTGLREITGGSLRTVGRILDNFVKTGLAAIFDDRYFLAERGMKRAANLSRLRLDTISKRHAALLNVNFRHQERHHNDGVNRLVLKFASEGVKAFAGWRGEFNIPDITQIKPDLLVLVADGPFGTGPYCIEYERAAVHLNAAARKLGTYRKSAAVGQPVPVLVVCDTEYAAHNFIKTGRSLPVAATHLAAALTGPLTGDSTVWRQAGKPTDGGENWPDSSVRLHCRSSPKGTSDSF